MRIDEQQLYTYIGERLKQRRLTTNMTQTQLAEAVGVLRTSITNIEAGRQKPPLFLLYNLCDVLGIEVLDILPTSSEIMPTENSTFSTDESLQIHGDFQNVPPKTAKVLKQLLDDK